MATYNKFQPFVEHLAEGVHNLASDTIEVALYTTAPAAATALKASLTGEIAYTNLTADRTLTVSSSSQTSGTYSLVLNDKVIAASGGAGAAFRYIVIFNQSTAALVDPLICWFDYGSSLTLNDGESLTIDFGSDGGSTGTLLTIT